MGKEELEILENIKDNLRNLTISYVVTTLIFVLMIFWYLFLL